MDISTGRRRLTAGSAAAVAGLAAVTVAGLPSPASAQPVCFGVARTVRFDSSTTCTYSYTGTEQTFVVPAGVTSVNVVAIGAAGGNGATPVGGGTGGTGGAGEIVSAAVAVQPGTTLYVEVGGAGGNGTTSTGGSGGFDGGAAGADSHTGGGGGGGASDVRQLSNLAGGTLASRLVIAAGGGGGGGGGDCIAGVGGGGGDSAASAGVGGNCVGVEVGGTGGANGTGVGGGGGGTGGASGGGGGSAGGNGTAGALGAGGAPATVGAGGGGGGLYGGGGGGGAAVSGVPHWGGGGGGGAGSSGTAIAGTVVTDLGETTQAAGVSFTFTIPGPGTSLGITTPGTLPAGRVGHAYHVRLAASGGTLPYVWSLVSGHLPPRLSLSRGGMLRGIPTKAGTWVFTVKVTDSAGASATQQFHLKILRGPAHHRRAPALHVAPMR
jgi:putative Ig domain-containing protein